jgi:hypothetical protein
MGVEPAHDKTVRRVVDFRYPSPDSTPPRRVGLSPKGRGCRTQASTGASV